ncbi:MAG: PTH1 family [Verrucomicrobia bacterium]|nr:MAG: PTH1 family [Verrucomicrobiota bacterium]
MSSLRLVVGLGNPGAEYENTRHNVGFMTLDRLAQGVAEWKREQAWQAQIARVDGVVLCKPETFMNLSGRALLAVARFYQIPTEGILVVLDEMALPLGRLRLRVGGSAAGHNGMKSIIETLGTQEVARLRLGIGGAAPGEAVGHVLGRFRKDERPALEEMLARSEDAIRMVQREGLQVAMNAFN